MFFLPRSSFYILLTYFFFVWLSLKIEDNSQASCICIHRGMWIITLFSGTGSQLPGNLSIPRVEIISWPDVSFTGWSRAWRSQWKALRSLGLSSWISCRWSKWGPRAPSGHLAEYDSGQQLFISSCCSHFPPLISVGCRQTGEQESGRGWGWFLMDTPSLQWFGVWQR